MSGATSQLLEREAELERLEVALTDARSGSGGVVLVEGPAGIGKGRLLAEAEQRASRAGTLVLTARGGELERQFAFGIARQLFEPALLDLGVAERAPMLKGAAALAGPAVGVGDAAGGSAVGDRLFAVVHGLYWLGANLAANGPLVLASSRSWCSTDNGRKPRRSSSAANPGPWIANGPLTTDALRRPRWNCHDLLRPWKGR